MSTSGTGEGRNTNVKDCFGNETYLSLLLSDHRCGGFTKVAISHHQVSAFSPFEQKFIRSTDLSSADSHSWEKCNMEGNFDQHNDGKSDGSYTMLSHD